MRVARAHLALSAAILLLSPTITQQNEDILYNITEAEYYEMPALFELDEWEGCLAGGGVYCVGSFELSPEPGDRTPAANIYDRMQRYSANWADNFNHTRVHRAACVSRRCAAARRDDMEAWFSSCVNSSTVSSHGMVSRLYKLEYCRAGPRAPPPPPDAQQRAFAAFVATILALVTISTVLDITIADQDKKGSRWWRSCSLVVSWRALQAPPPAGSTDLRVLDGLRVLCMWCVVIEHVCWLATQHYITNVWQFEQMRRDTDVMLMTNSTLVVQIFFLMSSFLLAHKLLQQRRRGAEPRPVYTFLHTMLNRIIRVSPSYFVVVWFAASWWQRLGEGPLWAPLVGAEADTCRRKWWTHLLYMNNIIDADNKCLIQTWYLAADMQLYALSLALTLALGRLRRGALYALAALLVAAVLLPAAMAYAWHLVPTFVMHRPELVRAIYSGERSFNVLYQSPVSNAAGALAGLLLAHAHHALLDAGLEIHRYKLFRWSCALGPYAALCWAAQAPRLLGAGPPKRAPAAALAALERPLFSFFVAIGILGAMHDVKSPLRSVLSWRGWSVPARLSFGVLLLHMPFNKWLVASRLQPSQINRQLAFVECFGVSVVSCVLALPLALCVEYPAQQLLGWARGARGAGRGARPPRGACSRDAPPHTEKTDL